MGWYYRSEYVRCGHNCSGCPHGPYWYRYKKVHGKTRKEYVGKTRTFSGNPEFPEVRDEDAYRSQILNRDKATLQIACDILGIGRNATLTQALAVYRALAMLHHPDRGGDAKEFCLLSAAWSYMCWARDWH